MADPIQLHQVIMNLCTNAGGAMREKGGILNVKIVDFDVNSEFVNQHPNMHSGTHIKLTISDTGHGIPIEIMGRIFDPFFTTKGKSGGTGMGLSVAHGIIQNHGGTIGVDSESGKGTTFNVFIPAIEGEAITESERVESLPLGTEQILFVDDEEFQVDLGKQMLERLRYNVTAKTSSLEALELFRNDPKRFDLLITDMTMPNMTGESLSTEVLKIRSDIPIILCTGYSEVMTKEKAEAIGIKGFLMKPIVMSDLSRMIRKVLDNK